MNRIQIEEQSMKLTVTLRGDPEKFILELIRRLLSMENVVGVTLGDRKLFLKTADGEQFSVRLEVTSYYSKSIDDLIHHVSMEVSAQSERTLNMVKDIVYGALGAVCG